MKSFIISLIALSWILLPYNGESQTNRNIDEEVFADYLNHFRHQYTVTTGYHQYYNWECLNEAYKEFIIFNLLPIETILANYGKDLSLACETNSEVYVVDSQGKWLILNGLSELNSAAAEHIKGPFNPCELLSQLSQGKAAEMFYDSQRCLEFIASLETTCPECLIE